MQGPIQPPILGRLQPGRSRFHEILRIEVGARRIGRPGRMYDRKMTLIPQRLQRRHSRMQPEEPVKIDHRIAWNVDGRSHRVVRLLPVRNHDIQPIRRPALKNHNQTLVPSPSSSPERCTGQEAGNRGRTHNRQRAIPKKDASCNGHKS